MKRILSKVLAASLMSVGFVSVSTTDAFANQTCDVDNIFADIATYTGCEGAFSGNDNENEVNNIFKDVYDSNTSVSFSDKLDASSGDTDWFRITNNGAGNDGQIEFLKDIDYKFSFVLKAGNTWSSYFFDGIEAGTILDFTTAGVSQNGNGSAAALSHATLYVSNIEREIQDAIDEENNKEAKVYVPEPSAMVGLAFLGSGMFLSRRRKSS